MRIRWLVSAFFLLLSAGAAYVAWRTSQAGQDSRWVFGVFAAFFLATCAAPFLPQVRRRPPPDMASAETRFGPHWFMMLAVVVFAAAVVLLVVSVIRHA